MNANEAVILFKNDCFTREGWKRAARRYQNCSVRTLVCFISNNYDVKGVSKSEIEAQLRLELEKALNTSVKK